MHNRVVAHPGDQREFEALVRYMMRPAVSLDRLHFTPGSHEVLYVPKAGHDDIQPSGGERIEPSRGSATSPSPTGRDQVGRPAPGEPALRPQPPRSDGCRGPAPRAASKRNLLSLRGDLTSSDPVEVHGSLEGDSRVTARFTVGEKGPVFGNVDAATLVVPGEVTAGVLTAERIELRSTARVWAMLRARVVGIAAGAFFEGDIDNQERPESTGT